MQLLPLVEAAHGSLAVGPPSGEAELPCVGVVFPESAALWQRPAGVFEGSAPSR